MVRMSSFCSSRCVAKAVTQRVHGDALVDVRGLGGLVHGAVQLPGTHGFHRIQARKETAVGQDLALGPGMAPPTAQPLEQDRRQQCVAILVALALLDTQHMRLLSMSPTFKANHFADAKAGAIGHRQSGAMLEVAGRLDQARRFLATQD